MQLLQVGLLDLIISSEWDSSSLRERYLSRFDDVEKELDWPLENPLWAGCSFK